MTAATGTRPTQPPAGAALHLRGMVKSFGGRVVLDVAELEIARGEIHALLGQNGSGKSTLIKILSGYHAPDGHADACISVQGTDIARDAGALGPDAGIRFVHQDLALIPAMSVLDNIYLGRDYPTRAGVVHSHTARANASQALGQVGLADLDPSTLLGRLSPAERSLVAMARALATDGRGEPQVLVLDEPTATLPAGEVDRLLSTLGSVATSGVGVLYVTHHLDEVFRIAHRASILRDGQLVASGPVAEFTRDQIVHHLIGAELEDLHDLDHSGSTAAPAGTAGQQLAVEALSGPFFEDVSFQVSHGEIVGMHGLTGSGRDTVLGTIFGATDRTAGSVRVVGVELLPGRPDLSVKAGIGFVPADRKAHGVILTLKARENLVLPDIDAFSRAGRVNVAVEAAETYEWFAKLDVRPATGAQLPVASFSGGNQQKIVLAKWLRRNPKLLLLDEPTQGVDVGAKAAIHRSILDAAAAGVAVVVASSDEEELAALCATVHVFKKGRITDTLTGPEISDRELSRRLNVAAGNPAYGADGSTA